MKLIFLLGLTLLTANGAWAFPLPKDFQTEALQLPLTFTTHYDFEGIVALSNCSGSLIRFETSQETDKAMVLTNGHCLESGFVDAGEHVYDQESDRSFSVLNSAGQFLGEVTANRVVYATMTNTDITLYSLNETYADIKMMYHVNALTLASKSPAINDAIEVVSGYWKRGYSCGVEKFVNELHEAGWVFKDSLRYSRPGCETIGGTSGSPVVLAGSKTIVAINNTGNENGRKCTMNNPCEVEKDGSVSYQKGFSYGQQTYWIYSCLTADRKIDLGKAGCELPH